MRDIPDGKQSEAISLPDTNPNILKGILSGFKYTYDPNHCVKTVYARAGTTSDGTLAYITGKGEMCNDNNDFADTTIEGALLDTLAGFDYLPFGGLLSRSGSIAEEWQFTYAGKYWESGLGLYDFGARLYELLWCSGLTTINAQLNITKILLYSHLA